MSIRMENRSDLNLRPGSRTSGSPLLAVISILMLPAPRTSSIVAFLQQRLGDTRSFVHSPLYKMLCTVAAIALLAILYLLHRRREAAHTRLRLCGQFAQRERLTRERHDTFFQGMQGLLLRFHTGAALLPHDDPARRIFEEALQQSDLVMIEGRDLTIDSRPQAPGAHDLSLAYAAAGQELQRTSPVDFKVFVTGSSEGLHSAVFDELQRLGTEALTNAFRHARARHIEAELNYRSNELRVFFRDNGVGIDPNALKHQATSHHGLPAMQERARKMGAQMDIWSRQGAGTEVEIRISAAVAYRSTPVPRGLHPRTRTLAESEVFYE